MRGKVLDPCACSWLLTNPPRYIHLCVQERRIPLICMVRMCIGGVDYRLALLSSIRAAVAPALSSRTVSFTPRKNLAFIRRAILFLLWFFF